MLGWHATRSAGEEGAHRPVGFGDHGRVGAALDQPPGHGRLAPANGDLQRREAVRVGGVDRRAGIEQGCDRPGRPAAPDRLVEMGRRRPRAVGAEHLDHCGVGEVERSPEVVVDQVLPGAGVDDEHRARRVTELAGVVEDLVAVQAVALVGRVRARVQQHARQLWVAGDPSGAVERDLQPIAGLDERRVRVGSSGEQAAHHLADRRCAVRVAAQQPGEAGVQDRRPSVRACRLAHQRRPRREPARDLVGLPGGTGAGEIVAG